MKVDGLNEEKFSFGPLFIRIEIEEIFNDAGMLQISYHHSPSITFFNVMVRHHFSIIQHIPFHECHHLFSNVPCSKPSKLPFPFSVGLPKTIFKQLLIFRCRLFSCLNKISSSLPYADWQSIPTTKNEWISHVKPGGSFFTK